MARSSRILRALLIATSMAALIAAPVIAAKPPPKPDKPAPSFAVALNLSDVDDLGTDYLALTFTSTSPKRAHGFARFELPTRFVPRFGFSVGFWQPLQTTAPLDPGYFRIEATSCGDAVLASFSNGVIDPDLGYTTNPSIEVEFNCAPGQAFVIHWFVEPRYHTLDSCCFYDIWTLPVASRSTASRPWTAQTSPTLRVHGHYITLPPLPWITPPLQIVNMVPIITAPEEPPNYFVITGDAIALNTQVTSEITVNRIFRADTGAELVLVDPYAFRVDQQQIQVTSCIDLPGLLVEGVSTPPGVPPYDFSSDCAAMPEVLTIMPNPGSVANADGTLLSSQIAVIVGVFDFFTAPSQWKAAESRCLFRGGVYHEHGNVDELWTCTLPAPAPNNDRYYFVANDLGQAAYCPTGRIRADPSLVERQIIACIP